MKVNTTMIRRVWNEKITRHLKKFGKILRDISTRRFETQVPAQEPAIIIGAKQTPENTSIGTSEPFSINTELPTSVGDQSSNEASKKLEENESLTIDQEDSIAISNYQNEDHVFSNNIQINGLFSSTEEIQTLCNRERSNIKDCISSPRNTTLKS